VAAAAAAYEITVRVARVNEWVAPTAAAAAAAALHVYVQQGEISTAQCSAERSGAAFESTPIASFRV